MSGFWKGTLKPLRKGTCSHGNIMVSVGIPEFGLAPVYVQFNHNCSGNPAPSNATVYTFEVELDDFTDGENTAAVELQSELDNMNDTERLTWVNENLLADQGLDITNTFW